MAEQLKKVHSAAEKQPAAMPVLIWLRARLLPPGEDILMIVAYIMILTAIIAAILAPSSTPPWRFYGTILALSALLVLNITLPDIRAVFGEATLPVFLLLSAGLVVLANWLGLGGGGFTFLPFLIFLLTGQAFTTLRFRYAVLYSIALEAAWLAVAWGLGISLEDLVNSAASMGAGVLFTALFSIVITRYGQQTARAEALLEDLRAANAELAAARQREKELAVAEERVRLARDIHDGLGHHLTVLNVQLQAASKLIERDPARAASAIAACKEEAQAALDEVRQSVAAMRRSPLDGRTLDQAIQALVRDFDRHASIAASFELSGAPAPLSPADAQTLYRAAQEGLTNAQKHAAARHVVVALEYGRASVRLRVHDDGAGVGSNGAGSGFGLAGLRERAEQLGGDFSAGPHEDGGFGLEMVLPVKNET